MADLPTRPTSERALIRIVAAVVVGALFAGLGAAVVGRSSTAHESRAVLAIDQGRALAAAQSDGIVLKLSRLRSKYTGLVQTDVIAGPAATKAGTTTGAIRSAVRATADPNNLLVVVTARTGAGGDTAQRYAGAVAQTVVDYVQTEQEGLGVPPEQRFTFQVVVPATKPETTGGGGRRRLAVGLLAGLIGFGLAWAGASFVDDLAD
jgi:hypothetical protein